MTVLLPAMVSVTRLLLMVGIALLCACGQTGPLYLPDESVEQQPAGAADASKQGTATADHH